MNGGTACIPDVHVPYHDPVAVRAACRALVELKPSRVVLLGDFVDCYAVSRFCRDPVRVNHLQDEFDQSRDVLTQIRRAAPDCRIDMLEGNHELRLRTYLWSRTPELASLRCLTIPDQLGMRELKVTYYERGWLKIGRRLYKHGEIVRPHSGYTAMNEMRKAGVSIVIGHTHRLGHVWRTSFAGNIDGAESGCLCRIDAEAFDYMRREGVADWQHGMVYVGPAPWSRSQLIPIDQGRFELGVKAYSATVA